VSAYENDVRTWSSTLSRCRDTPALCTKALRPGRRRKIGLVVGSLAINFCDALCRFSSDHSSKELKKEFFQPHGSAYRTKEKSPSQKLLPEAKPQLQPSAAIVLSPEQTQVLDRVKAGQNVFFTGSAGNVSPQTADLRLLSRFRNGQIGVAEGDHLFLRRFSFSGSCNYCLYRYSLGQHWWDDFALMGGYWNWQRICRQTGWEILGSA
jgi:hypothetical protein